MSYTTADAILVDNRSSTTHQEYNYLFENDGQWYVQSEYLNNGNWTHLKNAVEAIENGQDDVIIADPDSNAQHVEYVCVNNMGMEEEWGQ